YVFKNRMIKSILYKITFLVVFVFFSSSSCEKNRYDFPYVPINLKIELVRLNGTIGPGEYEYMYDNYGVNGLIIHRNFSDNFFVYDRTCTYEPDYLCTVTDDTTSSLHVSCPCCGSQYFLDESGDAFVTKGPSKYPLVQYQASINSGFLWIYN
ncbi:MAG: ubiquinol-cytochrome c reductase iron-sulfur subunit, partial [Bacteroidota bacterium]